jgi:CcmD family protein
MEYLGYLFAAYSIVWAVVFGYVLYMQRKQRRLQRQVDRLREILDGRDNK